MMGVCRVTRGGMAPKPNVCKGPKYRVTSLTQNKTNIKAYNKEETTTADDRVPIVVRKPNLRSLRTAFTIFNNRSNIKLYYTVE